VSYTSVGVQGCSVSINLSPGRSFKDGHWRSVAVQFVSEPKICHGVLELYCVQMRVSGCNNHYETVLGAGAKAKSVTSLLTLPSVLAGVVISFIRRLIIRCGSIDPHLNIFITWKFWVPLVFFSHLL